jgi:RND superfamily putative drug exporter
MLFPRVRDECVPSAFSGTNARVYVTGQSQTQDMIHLMARYTPIVFAFVLGLSFVLLLILFRSI